MRSIAKTQPSLPFQGADSYDYMMDMDNYIETQSRILTSETMALETIRSMKLDAERRNLAVPGTSDAIASGTLENKKLPPASRQHFWVV